MQRNSKHKPVKIAGGSLRGRKLLPPPGTGTRPMTGLAKKSIFSIVLPWLEDAVVLDLYSGTGTIGLESLSRGAKLACFAERDRAVLNRLQRNIEDCDMKENSQIWAGNIESKLGRWIEKLDQKIDVAFLDPPYPQVRNWKWSTIENKLFIPISQSLADDGLVVLRTPGKIEPPKMLGNLQQKRVKEYGDMRIFFYTKPDEKSDDPVDNSQADLEATTDLTESAETTN